MTTVIRIQGANFNNDNLPVIPRLVGGQLKFSYKPSILNGFVDHSGQSDLPSVIGSPVLKIEGLYCGTDDGYRSAIKDTTDELTAIVVFSEEQGDAAGADTMPVGCYNSTTSTGWGLYFKSGTVRVAVFNSGGNNTQGTSDNAYTVAGQWAAIRITKDTLSLFTAENGVLVKKDFASTYTARTKTITDAIGIGAAPRSTWPTQKDLTHEATLYQRALSDAELLKAYEYSSAYFDNHTSIDI
mgnify:CR=1 FL=1